MEESLWRAVGFTPRLRASHGAVGKMDGLITQHWGRIKISDCLAYHINLISSQERREHAAVVMQGDNRIIIIGGWSSRLTGEIVKSKFASWYPSNIRKSIKHSYCKWWLITGGKQFNLQNGGYGTCAVAYKQTEFVMIGGRGDSGHHGKVDR